MCAPKLPEACSDEAGITCHNPLHILLDDGLHILPQFCTGFSSGYTLHAFTLCQTGLGGHDSVVF